MNKFDRAEILFSPGGYLYGKTIFERIIPALSNLSTYLLGLIPFSIFMFFTLVSIKNIKILIIFIFSIIYMGIWSYFWGYDIRNITPILPFLGYLMGIGFSNIISFILRYMKKEIIEKLYNKFLDFKKYLKLKIQPRIYNIRIAVIGIITIIIIFFGFSFIFTNEYITNEFTNRQMNYIGDFNDINSMVYKLKQNTPALGRILTTYLFVTAFPGIDVRYEYFISNITQFTNIQKEKDVNYLLWVTSGYWNRFDLTVQFYFESQISNGSFIVVDQTKNGKMIKIGENNEK
jgi:hypothetical protein